MAAMIFHNDDAEREFQFWTRKLDHKEPESQFVTLTSRDVMEVHFALIDHFSSQGVALGGVGPRDIGLLQSTPSRQFTSFGGNSKWDNQYEVVATLFYGLVQNHPFHDA